MEVLDGVREVSDRHAHAGHGSTRHVEDAANCFPTFPAMSNLLRGIRNDFARYLDCSDCLETIRREVELRQ